MQEMDPWGPLLPTSLAATTNSKRSMISQTPAGPAGMQHTTYLVSETHYSFHSLKHLRPGGQHHYKLDQTCSHMHHPDNFSRKTGTTFGPPLSPRDLQLTIS
jgi:hypothetical protein